MSEEEKIENNENKEKIEQNCKFTTLVTLIIVSLLFSITSLTLSIMNIKGVDIKGGDNAPAVVISKKYDKGQSLSKALETKKPIIAFFYVDWCGFCQRFAPTFHKISKDYPIKKNFAIAYINCQDPENQKFVEEYSIGAFPTVYVIKENGEKIQLQNELFFQEESKSILVNKALEIIGKL